MASFFTWLDHSESERKKVLDVVQAFSDRDTRDELGIGTVRDAYADLLAPGTSTIQTRIRYFLFVPWIYLRVEQKLRSRKAASREEISKLAREEEIRLIDFLADSDNSAGTIGIDARKTLKRLPSSIYWNGLQSWGIRQFHGSQEQYSLSLFSNGPPPNPRKNSGETGLENTRHPYNWHLGLPPCPPDFPGDVSFQLTQEEAGYLRERILHNAPGTYLAFLADQGDFSKQVDFPWEHPQIEELPGHIYKQLVHARNFSETIHGAALIYNYMLARRAEAEIKIEEYERKFSEWAEMVKERSESLSQWDNGEFWDTALSANQRIPERTKSFINSWLILALQEKGLRGLLDSSSVQNLIENRERFLKKNQARLFNSRALELWSGAAGTARLDYRWGTVRTFLTDIHQASKEGTDNA
jgi:hypothetical protein